MKFSTKAIHVGQEPDPTSGAIIPPIVMSSTYIQESPGVYKGYDYTRAGNPNFTALEAALASLEEAEYATVFSSGLGAVTALASTLSSGDHVLATNDLYGGTYRLFKDVFEKFGITFELVDTADLALVEERLKEKPKFLLIESPTNPLLKISDISAISALAKSAGVLVILDNTFATPYFQNPITLGADIVVHSTTKYIGGHSDVVGGAVITSNQKVKDDMDFARKVLGVNPSPFDTWLTLRGLKTLAVRMERHAQNAIKIAEFLEGHEKVSKVYYPGLKSHANHEIAKKQMRGFSGIVSVEFNLPYESMTKLISSFNVFSLAESLGGIESLVDHPASMTHASIPKEERAKIGISDGLVRLSIGIEDGEDLLDDLKTQLDNV
jgi:cystathionine beta-lyase/cystathionine gamma-synthase